VGDILSPGGTPVGLNLATAQAASVPLISGATESAIILGEQAMRDYERQFQDFQNFTGQQLADFSAGRKAAILASMGRAGFGEDEINATLAQLGLRNGGRVGFEMEEMFLQLIVMKKVWVELFIMMKKENLFHKKKQWNILIDRQKKNIDKKITKLWVEL
jgi:hypothetical protein